MSFLVLSAWIHPGHSDTGRRRRTAPIGNVDSHKPCEPWLSSHKPALPKHNWPTVCGTAGSPW